MHSLYASLLEHLPEAGNVKEIITGRIWTMARMDQGSSGISMTTLGHTIPEHFQQMDGLAAWEAAAAVCSWNLEEASAGMAVINASYNTAQRLEALHCSEPYENYCTDGLDLCGKTIGVVGHLTMPEKTLRLAKDVYILERNPRPGDYPDSACEYLLPKCDVVLITGSSLINKTLPRLLELTVKAYTILTGPTVPMCPELLNFGIQRMAGMVVSNQEAMLRQAAEGIKGPPYCNGTTFLLKDRS